MPPPPPAPKKSKSKNRLMWYILNKLDIKTYTLSKGKVPLFWPCYIGISPLIMLNLTYAIICIMKHFLFSNTIFVMAFMTSLYLFVSESIP